MFEMLDTAKSTYTSIIQVACVAIPEFIEYLRKRGIEPFEAVEEDLERAERL
jgi:ribose 1,5-bisphosphokinase PhnN